MITHVNSIIESTVGSDQLDDLFLNQLQQLGMCRIPILYFRQRNPQTAIDDAAQYANHLAGILACSVVTGVAGNHLVVRVVS